MESKVCENAANCPDHFSHLYTEYATMPPQCQHVVDNKVDLSFVDSAISKNTDSQMSSGRGYSGSGFVEVIDAGLYAEVDGATTKMKPPMAVHNTTIEPITNKTWGELDLKTSFAHYDAALKQSHQCALAKIRSIRDSGWLDELTRAIFIEYCVSPYWSIVPHRVNTKMSATRRWERGSDEFCEYNPSKNPQSPGSGKCHLKESVGACHRVVFEQNRYGRVTTTQTVMTARADSEPGDLAHKGLMLMIVCIVGLSLTVVIEFTEFLYSLTSEERRSAYLQPSSVFWNMMDLACICGLCMTLYNFPFAHQPFSPDSLEYMTHNDGQMGWQPVYTQFDVLDALEHTRYWFAITTLMWWMRGVEYFGVFPVLQLPIMALWYSISTVFSFLAFFAMLLVGASMCFRFLYGTASDAFADLSSSIMSMLLASIGEFRTEAIMVDYRKSDAEFWMLMWAIVMSFVVLTMFVAIIDQGYQDAKESLEEHPVTGAKVTVKFINGKVAGQAEEPTKKKKTEDTGKKLKKGKFKKKKKRIEYFQGKIGQVNLDGTFDIEFRADDSESTGLAKIWDPAEDDEDDLYPSEEDHWKKIVKRGVSQKALVFLPQRQNGSILTLLLTQWVDKLVHYSANVKKNVRRISKATISKVSLGNASETTDVNASEETVQTSETKNTGKKFFDTKIVPVSPDV